MDGMVHAGVAVTVRPDADAHAFEEIVGRHERRVDLDRHRFLGAGRSVLPTTLIAVPAEDFVRHHRMAGIGLVLDHHLPIAMCM